MGGSALKKFFCVDPVPACENQFVYGMFAAGRWLKLKANGKVAKYTVTNAMAAADYPIGSVFNHRCSESGPMTVSDYAFKCVKINRIGVWVQCSNYKCKVYDPTVVQLGDFDFTCS